MTAPPTSFESIPDFSNYGGGGDRRNLQKAAGSAKSSPSTPTSVFAESLTNFDDSFEVTYWKGQRGRTFDEFADGVYEFGMQNAASVPYLYGSYEIFEANQTSHTYKFVSYQNLTSSASVVLFP